MKNLIFYLTVVMITTVAFETATCQTAPIHKQMTMTTAKSSDVKLNMQGSGTFTIDWGDGSRTETYTFQGDQQNNYWDSYVHSYTRASPRTITIIGEDITHIDCSYNQLTSLDVSKNAALTFLYCSVNELTSLNVDKNIALTVLDCSVNHFTSLDVSKNTALTELGCTNNSLSSLDVSKNTDLTKLWCSTNIITSLDLSNNTALTELWCFDNGLTVLDVSKNTALTLLWCFDNLLTDLDVSKNTSLIALRCNNNQLTSLALNTLFGTLPSNMLKKEIKIDGNPGTETCDPSIAEKKGWTFQ